MTSDKPKTYVPRGRLWGCVIRANVQGIIAKATGMFFHLVLYVCIHIAHQCYVYMPGCVQAVRWPFFGFDFLSNRRIFPTRPSVQAARMETGLTGFNGSCPWSYVRPTYEASTRRPLLHASHLCVRCTLDMWYISARERTRLREKENPSENASASNRRASNRTRGARQPADTIVTGCINPPSWYPQGRASNPKVNALDSTTTALRLLHLVVDFFFWTFPASPNPFLPHASFFLLFCFRFFLNFYFCRSLASRFSRSRLRVRWRISSGHERDVTAINPADTALARVGWASGHLPHFLPLLLSPSLPSSSSIPFDLTTSASRTEW